MSISEFFQKEYLQLLIKIAVIIVIAVIVSEVLRKIMSGVVKKSSDTLRIDPTRIKFMKNAMSSIVYLFAIIAIIHTVPQLRAISLTLITGAGIFAAIIGFASQQAFANIVSGIFVVLSKPFRVGDIIRVGQEGTPTSRNEVVGIVEDITLRHTVIRDFENRRIIIPNSVINMETIFNNDVVDRKVGRNININISYESDIDKAIAIIQEESRKHPNYMDNRSKEELDRGESDVLVRVVELGDWAVKLRAYVWAKDFDHAFEMHCDLNKTIVERFRKEKIEIPYPHQTTVFKQDIFQK